MSGFFRSSLLSSFSHRNDLFLNKAFERTGPGSFERTGVRFSYVSNASGGKESYR